MRIGSYTDSLILPLDRITVLGMVNHLINQIVICDRDTSQEAHEMEA